MCSFHQRAKFSKYQALGPSLASSSRVTSARSRKSVSSQNEFNSRRVKPPSPSENHSYIGTLNLSLRRPTSQSEIIPLPPFFSLYLITHPLFLIPSVIH